MPSDPLPPTGIQWQAMMHRMASIERRMHAKDGRSPWPNDKDPLPLPPPPAGDLLELIFSSTPGTDPAQPNVIGLSVDGVEVTTGLVITCYTGMNIVGAQRVTLHGDWGPAPHTILISDGGSGKGTKDLWWLGGEYDGQPLFRNGKSLNTHGGDPVVNGTSDWDNLGEDFEISTEKAPEAPPIPVPPPAQPSVVAGATIDGLIQPPATLAALVGSLPGGSTLTLPAGVILGAARIDVPCRIEGAGMGVTIIDGAGIKPALNKALLVPTVPGVVITDMTIRNAHIGSDLGGNAAGVRNDDGATDLTLQDVEITGCQNGILASSAAIVLVGCATRGNGAGNSGGAATHEIYIQTGCLTLDISGHTSECGRLSTHALKSRARHTYVTNSHFTGNGDDGSNGGTVIDIPNGGSASFTDCEIIMGGGAGNHGLIGYGSDGNTNAAAGTTLTLEATGLHDSSGSGGTIVGIAGATLELGAGVTYSGPVAPQTPGWESVNGNFTAAPG